MPAHEFQNENHCTTYERSGLHHCFSRSRDPSARGFSDYVRFRKKESAKKPAASSTGSAESARYIPGIYTSTISLGDQTFDIQVDVEQDRITAISMNNLSETTAAMYPLMEPALDSIASQIYVNQTTEASFTARITATPPNCLSWQSTRLSIRPAILLQPNKVKNGS